MSEIEIEIAEAQRSARIAAGMSPEPTEAEGLARLRALEYTDTEDGVRMSHAGSCPACGSRMMSSKALTCTPLSCRWGERVAAKHKQGCYD